MDDDLHQTCHAECPLCSRFGKVPCPLEMQQASGRSRQAIDIIYAEHRSLAAVLHGLLYVVRDIRLRGSAPRFDVLDAMVRYIDAVPERFHHPKEDEYLFRYLAMRCPEAVPLIDRLQADHRMGAAKIRELAAALDQFRQGGAPQFGPFAEAAAAYAASHWDHMRVEEDTLIPLAREHLTEEDWKLMDAAFSGHSDPLFGAQAGQEYKALFQLIVNLAPRPLGLGLT